MSRFKAVNRTNVLEVRKCQVVLAVACQIIIFVVVLGGGNRHRGFPRQAINLPQKMNHTLRQKAAFHHLDPRQKLRSYRICISSITLLW